MATEENQIISSVVVTCISSESTQTTKEESSSSSPKIHRCVDESCPGTFMSIEENFCGECGKRRPPCLECLECLDECRKEQLLYAVLGGAIREQHRKTSAKRDRSLEQEEEEKEEEIKASRIPTKEEENQKKKEKADWIKHCLSYGVNPPTEEEWENGWEWFNRPSTEISDKIFHLMLLKK